MTWPRACALIETLWSPPGKRDVDLFLIRLAPHLERLKAAGVNYRPLDRKPVQWEGARPTPRRRARPVPCSSDYCPTTRIVLPSRPLRPKLDRDVFEIETRGRQNRDPRQHRRVDGDGVELVPETLLPLSRVMVWQPVEVARSVAGRRAESAAVSWAKHRYFLNYCCFGYSLPWWDWAQWERLIDWMALNGINAPLAVTGQEAVWQAVGKRLELTDEQMRAFLAGPPYLPFGWMGCLDGWGGPLPQSWIDRHEDLGKKILARERALGMTPVLQGFTGHVPAAVAKKYPKARLHKVHWIEWNTNLLDPLDPLFAKVAKLTMNEQAKRFGTDHLYAADTFIEMTPPSGDLKYLGNDSVERFTTAWPSQIRRRCGFCRAGRS